VALFNDRPDHRSKVGNGRKLIEGLDGRSVEMRRLKELFAGFARTVGLDPYALDPIQFEIVKCAALSALTTERLQAQVAAGDTNPKLARELVRVTNTAARTLARVQQLGKKKGTPKTESPLLQYFRRPLEPVERQKMPPQVLPPVPPSWTIPEQT
jgi:hypothetical protein